MMLDYLTSHPSNSRGTPRRLALAAFVLGIAILPVPGMAAEPAKEGATITVSVQITTQEHGKTDIETSTINRVLKGQCLMVAQPPMQIGMAGPTAEQQAAVQQSQANGEAVAKQFTPSEDLTNQMVAAANKCGDDQACMMAEVQKLSGNSEIQTMAKNQGAAKAAIAGLTPDLGPLRYQQWQPQDCTGTITANDTFIVNDPGGEGGADAYNETTKIQGSAPAGPDWHGMIIETDLVAGTTTYQMMPIPPVTVASSSSLKGAGQKQISLIRSTPMPEKIGPLKGVLGKQSITLKGSKGTLGLSWQSGH
jgi:hypothetical protein